MYRPSRRVGPSGGGGVAPNSRSRSTSRGLRGFVMGVSEEPKRRKDEDPKIGRIAPSPCLPRGEEGRGTPHVFGSSTLRLFGSSFVVFPEQPVHLRVEIAGSVHGLGDEFRQHGPETLL